MRPDAGKAEINLKVEGSEKSFLHRVHTGCRSICVWYGNSPENVEAIQD